MTRRERRPQRIGRRLARQLVEDRHSGSGAEELRELLELAAPSTVTRADTARLGALLAAYREAAESTPSPRAAYRRRSVPRSLTVRTAAVLLVVSGAGVGAAGAGILPAPIQRAAHDLFGADHAPAPAGPTASRGTRTPGASPEQQGSATPSADAADPASSAASCEIVSVDPGHWRERLDPAEQAALSKAAGGQANVKAYCATILAHGTGATASPQAPKPSETHGNAHVTHSPDPHSSSR